VFSIKKQPGCPNGCGKVDMQPESKKQKATKHPWERKNESSAEKQQRERHEKNSKRPKQMFVAGEGWVR
jgi:hypothetical protein